MSNDLVGYSRAGDVFHYRWAAKRCLRLIYPNTPIQKIHIEGSAETEKAGEYVIDVSEYSATNDGSNKIDYYQLKHTTVQGDDPFMLSGLKDTIEGFAKRYVQHKSEAGFADLQLSFTIITNRAIADSFKNNIAAIVANKDAEKGFKKTIEKYTTLTDGDLAAFCSLLNLEDSAGNYKVQKDELRLEIAQLVAGSIENAQIENLVALVQEKVMPDSDGLINKEQVLLRFGITSEKELYPAPAVWDNPINIIERKQHKILNDNISHSSNPVIIHAAGGVGKSVFCRQLINSLPEGSLGIAYDCFGAGSYRNRSESRHKHRDCLVQIANELAAKGLCDPLIVQNTTLDEDIMRKFLIRIEASVTSLKKSVTSAQLFVVIDAADNAEMAAEEYSQSCFANELLREKMPTDCRLVMLCRTERIYLLQPQSSIVQLKLEPFSEEETLANLRKWFATASEKDGAEFHRLTYANPRVQANALDVKHGSVNELLQALGPAGTSVEDQIELQLNAAVSKIKDELPKEHHAQINSICLGLASLPPHIPIEVLSMAANVGAEHIKSFVSDIGRSLWLFDASIQFRDEPTETWFRKTFLGKKENFIEYIKTLEPFATKIPYVSEVLPQLYLQAEQYNKLISIALSDDFLPESNPIDARNVRMYRLQFAFKAALKLKKYKDAIKLAMRAGEEAAGNLRQLDLFQSNIDLLAVLQSKEKVQEIAFKRLLSGQWSGSENVYSASILSGVADYRGEARGYIRAATNWLGIQREKERKNNEPYRHKGIVADDVLELAYAYLNIDGVTGAIEFLFTFQSRRAIFGVVQDLTKRLIDLGRFEEINEFVTEFIREPYYLVAAISELLKVGKFIEADKLEICLYLLCSKKSRIAKPNVFSGDRVTPAIISFLEVCLHRNMPSRKILRVLRFYVPVKATQMVYGSLQSSERTVYLKALAMRAVLLGELKVDMDAILPSALADKQKKHVSDDKKDFREVIDGLFPWYLLRAQILCNKDLKFLDSVQLINKASTKARTSRYRRPDPLPADVAHVCASILTLYNRGTKEEIAEYYKRFLENDVAFSLPEKLNTLWNAHRLPHLEGIRHPLENSIYEQIKSQSDSGPDEISGSYIQLARAVLVNSSNDAGAYFDEAIKIVSKFGDEIGQRWLAVVALAERSCEQKTVSQELAYRFIRCAELVGENVGREKYWNRSKAMRICTRMSPGIGISALSRWRDRDVGRFEYQFEAVLIELITSKKISPATAWAMMRFYESHYLNEFLSICLQNESSQDIQHQIFEDAVYLLQIEGAKKDFWQDLKGIGDKFNIESKTLNSIISFYETASVEEKDEPATAIAKAESLSADSASEPDWTAIFAGVEIHTPDGFKNLLNRTNVGKETDHAWKTRNLLKEIFKRLDESKLWQFIDTLFLSDDINYYDAEDALASIPPTWKTKITYKNNLPTAIFKFGEQYAHSLISYDYFNSSVRTLGLSKELAEKLQAGMFSGLANGEEFADATTFFAFITKISGSVSNQEAVILLEYALSRFELHIEEDFGDGNWREDLQVSDDIHKNVTGFIWAALGSPRSQVRWNAVHCVRKLADFNCVDLIDALAGWMQFGKVGAFGHHNYPFYSLHARQYLLIVFARISIENTQILKKHSALFSHIALSIEHLLIQKFATDVALNIETSYPGIYEKTVLAALQNVGKNNLPVQQQSYNYRTDSYLHKAGKIDKDINFGFGYDFHEYWFEPLGKVFGITGQQVQEIAANLAVKEWKLEDKSNYNDDPRVGLWSRYSQERETWHHKYEYPRTDNLGFYVSYHVMLAVAARLYANMPVIKTSDWKENTWEDWISSHLLTRADGKWLADSRDAVPLKRPQWIFEDTKTPDDLPDNLFVDCLQSSENGESWLTVKGGWSERNGDRTERFSVSTAMVSTAAADALLRALTTCSNPSDYKLPDFDEDDMEIESGIFQLKGWVDDGNNSKELDEFDPYADNVSYPPYTAGETILEQLGLVADMSGKGYNNSQSQKVLSCEIWASHREDREEEPEQAGMRLKASLPFLKQLCTTLNCELIFEVTIDREISHKYSRGDDEYSKDQHKLFILSADGKLRTTDKDYQLG